MMASPFLGTAGVPIRFRAMLALTATVVVTPLVASWHPQSVKPPEALLQLVPIFVYELSVGLAMGLAVTVLMGGLEVAGNMLSQLSGLSMADVFDPSSGTSVPLYGRLMRLVATAVVVASGGYRLMFDAMMDSFTWMPPGGAVAPDAVALTLIEPKMHIDHMQPTTDRIDSRVKCAAAL